MWIKHNKALYNTDDISEILVARTKLKAIFKDGDEIVIGEFKTIKECEDIFANVSRALLFEDSDHPGIIIRDTKEKK